MAKQAFLLLIAFVAILAVLLVAERVFSPTFQQCIAADNQNKNPSAAEENPASLQVAVNNYVRCTFRMLRTYDAAITALATIIIAAFTGTLWFATSRQAELTREAFIADKRAFVFAAGIRALFEPDVVTGHFNWRISTIWQNSGDTPTRQLRLYSDGFLSNLPIAQTFDFNSIDPNAPAGAGMMGPKMISPAGQAPHMPHPALTPQDILDIQNGTKFFYFWGWARYFDTLPNTPEHITRFCWRILCTGNPFTFNPLINPNSMQFWNVYETRGNCADEECRLQGLG